MRKNLNYEPNVLEAFVQSCRDNGGPNFLLGQRRFAGEDGTLTDQDTGKIFSAELTEIADENIKKRNAYLIKKKGVGEAYESYGAKQAIETIKKKEEKYSDLEERILILDAFSCVPFSWVDYWQPIIDYGQKTRFAGIYACGMDRGKVVYLKIK
ncbi:MAG: hypothetical protein PHV42_04205 [Candidatus Pacebacteria bacterium]|nr:hypothetical protein [Candidatus Paceibacterota bacterium]